MAFSKLVALPRFRFKKSVIGMILITLFLISQGQGFSQQVSGQGLVQFSSQTQSWIPLNVERDLIPGTRVFNPSPRSIQVTLGGDTVSIGPFTEVTISSVRTNQSPTVLQVPSGSIRAQVRTASPQERGVRFQIQSPVATASVRGTEFQFGWTNLRVASGDVEIQNLLGQSHSVRENQQSKALAQEPIQSVEVSLRKNTRID